MAIFRTYTKSSKKLKPNTSKSFLAAKEEHAKFLLSMGVSVSKKTIRGNPANMPDLTVKSNVAPLSNAIPSNGFKRSVDDYKWRQGHNESKEAIEAAERKKTRVAPLWNKGSIMYIGDAEDLTTLGKKV
jgi:hypothetical protein